MRSRNDKVKVASGTGLEQVLKGKNTAIIGNTLHFETLGVHDLDGTMINPGDIVKAIESTDIFYHVWAAVKQTIDERSTRGIPDNALTKYALERLLFELGNAMLDRVEGPHLTFVDPRRHNNRPGMVHSARRLVSLFEEKGIDGGQIVVGIPATQEGVQAARDLHKHHGIHINLYLVTGLIHAAACAEAGATTISISVDRLLDWQERKRKTTSKNLVNHPGIETIQSTLAYFKLHGIKTRVVGSGFRSLTEIGLLGDFDAICLTKDQVDRLKWSQIAISTLDDSSPSALRARQAQFPTRFLESEVGFMNVMSAETRSTVAATMFVALGEMKGHMDALQQIVAKEVRRQFELQTLDLRALYNSPRARRETTQTSASCVPPGKASGSDLGDDEVF